MRPNILYLSIILLITTLLYSSHLPDEFTNWDDPKYITENAWIRSWNSQNLYHLTTEPFVANYLPVTMLSFSLDYQLWGLNSKGYHLHNLALHLICIVLVYFLLGSFSVNGWGQWLAVSLFAIHPANVESILWASERKNLLAALFFLLSFLMYIQCKSSQSKIHYLLSIFFYLISLLSKASAVTAVAVFLGYDYFIEGRKFKELKLYDKIPYLVLAEVTTFWTIHAAQISHSLATYHKQGIGVSLLAIPKILGEYLGLLLFPHHLNVLYLEHARYSWSSLVLWLSLFIMAGVVFFIWEFHRSVFFWLVFSLVLMLPVLNLVPLPVKMANRYLYLPQIGFWVIFGGWADKILHRWKDFQLLKKAFMVGVCCWYFFLIDQTIDTTMAWKNSYSLWEDSLKQDFKNPLAHINIAEYFLKHMNQPNRAAVHNLLALSFSPRSHLACYNLGVYFMQNKNWESSKVYLNKAITFDPEDDDATNALGAVYFAEKKWAHALLLFYRSIWTNPKNQQAWDNVFHVYARMERWKEAKETAHQMSLIFPDWPIGKQRLSECP